MPKRYRGNTPELVLAARRLRAEMTPAEHVLWEAIRRQALGARFRRQHPLGPYVLDFCCPEHHLVLEVDGLIHDQQADYDQDRTHHLEAYGYRVLRFRNDEVLTDLPAVLTRITAALPAQPVSPCPQNWGKGGWGVRGS